jgi:perosamine synthetase
MTNICAAIGVAQMEIIDKVLEKKQQIAQWYREGFRDSKFEFHTEDDNVVHSYWMCTILIPEEMDRQKLKKYLVENGIETRPMFFPIHTMPIYSQKYEKHEVAERLAKRGMNLPSYPELNKENINEIIDALNSFAN